MSSSPERVSGGAVGFAIRLHETVGMGDGDTVDATGTTGALSRVDKIVSGHGGLGAGRVRLTKDRLKRFSLLTSRVK